MPNYKGRTYAAPSADKTKTIWITAADGKVTKVTEGATAGWGGNAKSGLFSTVGVSVGFLNMLSNCCSKAKGAGQGVNVATDTAASKTGSPSAYRLTF